MLGNLVRLGIAVALIGAGAATARGIEEAPGATFTAVTESSPMPLVKGGWDESDGDSASLSFTSASTVGTPTAIQAVWTSAPIVFKNEPMGVHGSASFNTSSSPETYLMSREARWEFVAIMEGWAAWGLGLSDSATPGMTEVSLGWTTGVGMSLTMSSVGRCTCSVQFQWRLTSRDVGIARTAEGQVAVSRL